MQGLQDNKNTYVPVVMYSIATITNQPRFLGSYIRILKKTA